jgi:hypothetical protein
MYQQIYSFHLMEFYINIQLLVCPYQDALKNLRNRNLHTSWQFSRNIRGNWSIHFNYTRELQVFIQFMFLKRTNLLDSTFFADFFFLEVFLVAGFVVLQT